MATNWTDAEHAALDAAGITPNRQARELLYQAAQRTGLDPFARQLFLAYRKNTHKPEATVDGFRAVADKHDEYAGQDGPYWCGPDRQWTSVWISSRPPVAATIGVHRRGYQTPVYGIAHFAEFCRNENGARMRNWTQRPAHMLSLAAESIALRKAFPHLLSGIYTTEEMLLAEALDRKPTAADTAHTRYDKPLDPQEGAERAHRAQDSGYVLQAFTTAERAELLAAPITAPDTRQREELGLYLIRRIVALAQDPDPVMALHHMTERLGVLDKTIIAPERNRPEKLADYLTRSAAWLRGPATLDYGDYGASDLDFHQADAPPHPIHTDHELALAAASGYHDVEEAARSLLGRSDTDVWDPPGNSALTDD